MRACSPANHVEDSNLFLRSSDIPLDTAFLQTTPDPVPSTIVLPIMSPKSLSRLACSSWLWNGLLLTVYATPMRFPEVCCSSRRGFPAGNSIYRLSFLWFFQIIYTHTHTHTHYYQSYLSQPLRNTSRLQLLTLHFIIMDPEHNNTWKCKNCMTVNEIFAIMCHCCGAPNPATASPHVETDDSTPDSP